MSWSNRVRLTGALLTLAVPLVMHAAPSEPAPVARTLGLPSDTAVKTDKARTAPTPTLRKKTLKGKQAVPLQARPDPRQFGPDQPWETEFYVSNDVPVRTPLFALTSLSREP